MRFLLKILYVVLLLSFNQVVGQRQAGIWYFGENAGLDFNSTPSVALTNGSLNTEEGCSTVCNAQGDLLFYTDGITVFNKNHEIMANGTGLNGNSSATQSSIIVQQPGSAVLYYIFTVDAHQNALRNGYNYSIVDLSIDGGLGAVTTKNVSLFADEVCEKITAVKHANGVDFWILIHPWDTNQFYAYRLSGKDVSAPVISTTGVVHNNDRRSAIGYLKTSPDGSKLAAAIYTQNRVELFDFNTSSGIVSNPIQLNNFRTPYGIEFSPSGEYLYVSLFSEGELYQFDITSNNEATITNSAQLIASGDWLYGALQLAPDNRIYMAKTNTAGTAGSLNLDVINAPNADGADVNFVADSKSLGGRRCRLGLPNFVTSIFTLEFAHEFDCVGDNTEFTITSDLTNISNATWDFGDGTIVTFDISPFSVSHTYTSANTYDVNLEVKLITGGTDNVTQAVTIRPLPEVNDQNPVVWESVAGTGIAGGIDLTDLQGAINGEASTTYAWYSDADLTTLVSSLTSVSVSNGQQFWVEVNDGSCTNVALVTYTVKALPMAIDQNPVLCEDNYNTGIVSNVDLTLLEPAITNNNTFLISWFYDALLTRPVNNPSDQVISDGEIFYAQVSAEKQSSVAVITYNIQGLPEGNDISEQIWEDTFGSGIASGVDLTAYNNQVSGGNNAVWYQDEALTRPIPDPTNLLVNDQDIFYAYIDNETCLNKGSILFTVRSSPIANDLDVEECEDVLGSKMVSNVDLTLLDGSVNGGTTSVVAWFTNPEHTDAVSTPSNVTVKDGDRFYVLVQSNGESNSAVVNYTVLSMPIANDQNIVDFEDVPGSKTALGVDLNLYNNAILGGESNTINWYLDAELSSLITNPDSYDVVDGDVFYVYVSDDICSNIATINFSVVDIPVARNVFPVVCEDSEGSGNSVVNLTLLENQINEENGDNFAWFFDWPTEPNGLPVNEIPNPQNTLAKDGDRFFAAVSDAFNTNVSTVSYTVLSLPITVDQTIDVWEDTFGTGLATGINLQVYNEFVTSSKSSTITWYEDALLKTPVTTPGNVSVETGDDFYALVSDGACENSAQISFTVRNLPEANDLQVQLCEDEMRSKAVSSYNLSLLEPAINNDTGTSKEWFYDVGLSLPILNPTNSTVTNGDVFYLKVSFGEESNVGQVEFTVKAMPEAQNYHVSLCEDSYNSGTAAGVNLNSYQLHITNSANSSVIWYTDASFSVPLLNTSSVSVSNGDIIYARVWDGACENFAELSFEILTLPPTTDIDEILCEETFGASVISGINLTAYNSQVSNDPNAALVWYEDDQLSIQVANPQNVRVPNQSSFYAQSSNSNSCKNSGRLNFFVNSLPEANNLLIELCEDDVGSRTVSAYNLNDLNAQITSNQLAGVSWFEDESLLLRITNLQNYTVSFNESVYAKVDDGCENQSTVNFVVHEKPTPNLGADTTIFYTETKILSPVIDIRFLPGSYLWQDGTTASTYVVREEGLYTLEYTDSKGCVGYDEVMIFVDKIRIFVPNAFTPDGNGVNDTFGPLITGDIAGQEIEMYIYNRWGELIYEFTDLGKGWDGTYKGKEANTGVYVWILIVNGKTRQDGSVSLIR